MNPPFSIEEFFSVFEAYNSAIFPLQFFIIAIGLIATFLLQSESRFKNPLIAGFLAFLWFWIGIVYHLFHFTVINKAAYGFGALFILQGVFFVIEMSRQRLHFYFPKGIWGYLGYFFIWFGLILYPLISYFAEVSWLKTISLGLPCPTTILTFGFLMLTNPKIPKYLLIVPSIWAVIGTGAATNFGIYQDYVMLLSAIVANIYLLRRKRPAKVE